MIFKKSPMNLLVSLIISFITIHPQTPASATSILTQPHFYLRVDPSSSDAIDLPIPTLFEFIDTLELGSHDQIIGIHIPKIFAVRVVQQPTNDPSFVSNSPNVVTQFSLADLYGSKGFLAHNNYVGARFHEIGLGKQVFLIFGDGSFRMFFVSELLSFQALIPQNPYSQFRYLGNANTVISAEELFHWIYNEEGRVILQSCIVAHGNSNWGRYFVVAISPDYLRNDNLRFQQ